MQTPLCGLSLPQTGIQVSHLSWMQEAQPPLEPTSTVDLALMTLLRAERVTLQHLQALLAALIQTNATEMWVQVRALCSTAARSNVVLPYVCPSDVPVSETHAQAKTNGLGPRSGGQVAVLVAPSRGSSLTQPLPLIPSRHGARVRH